MYVRLDHTGSRGRSRRRRKAWLCIHLPAVLAGVGVLLLFMASGAMVVTDSLADQEMAAESAVAWETTEPAALPGATPSEAIPPGATPSEAAVPLIVVDPGHGGEDEGCMNEGILEKDINLQIAQVLKGKLKELGFEVMMTREDDTYIPKEERVELANQAQADLYISIHQNTVRSSEAGVPLKDGESQIRGIETWYDEKSSSRLPVEDNKRLVRLIHQETVKSTGAVSREIKDEAGLYVTSKTTMPSCLIETGFLSNPEERGMLVTSDYQEKIAAGISAAIDLYYHPKTMYLTFDDGPSEENTNTVLDILKARNIKATFFVVGENVRKHPETARRIVAEGHTIGIHCNRHEYEEVYQSVDSYIKDFEEAYRAVHEVTGADVQLFRFPGGSINSHNKKISEEIIKEMTARGLIYFDWNASLEDAVKKSEPEELVKNGKETTLGRKKVVLLAHDIVHSTALCLDELLDQLPEYKMEPLTPEVEPVQF